MKPNVTRYHYLDLDGIRGVLACTVMLFHFGLTTLIIKFSAGLLKDQAWGLSVDFFFILSGFVLSKSFERGRQSLLRYFARRLARLAPVFYVSTLIMILTTYSKSDILTIAANMLMVQSMFGYSSINFPSWSIPFELFLPVIPLHLWSKFTNYKNLCFVIALGGGIVSAMMFVSGTDLPLLRAASGLGLGFSLAIIQSPISHLKIDGSVTVILVTAIMLIMLFGFKWHYIVMLFHPIASLTILVGMQAKSIFSSKPFQLLGQWSYSIYLLHIPVLSLVIVCVGDDLLKGSIVIKGACVLITLVCSAGMYTFVEKPVMRLASGWSAPFPTVTAL